MSQEVPVDRQFAGTAAALERGIVMSARHRRWTESNVYELSNCPLDGSAARCVSARDVGQVRSAAVVLKSSR